MKYTYFPHTREQKDAFAAAAEIIDLCVCVDERIGSEMNMSREIQGSYGCAKYHSYWCMSAFGLFGILMPSRFNVIVWKIKME